jgi:hypothetical protein
MKYRISTVSYKLGAQLVSEPIYIQGANKDTDRVIMLRLYRDSNNNAVLSTSKKGVKQYQFSEPFEGGMFAYVSVNATKALIALNRIRKIRNQDWLELELSSMVPSPEEFASATPTKKL